VDPEARTVRVLLLGDGDFVEIGVYKGGDAVISPTLEDFSFRPEEIFPA
jgi:Uma2 family endonuclease